MLAECVEKCPDTTWPVGEHPRAFWRIAFHATYFAHLYLGQTEGDFQPWVGLREGVDPCLWLSPEEMLLEDPSAEPSYTRRDILDYIRYVDSIVDSTVSELDLESDDAGFPWYKGISKLSHEIMSVRHIQGHVGQLSELLFAQDPELELKWTSRATGAAV